MVKSDVNLPNIPTLCRLGKLYPHIAADGRPSAAQPKGIHT